MNECIEVKGRFKLTCDQTGEVILDQDNLVVSAGKDWIAGRMAGDATVLPIIAIAAGTGTTATDAADTALETELDRVALTVAGGSNTDNTVVFSGTFGLTEAVGALTEFGLFTSTTAESGTMLARTVQSVVNKPNTMSYTASWIISLPY